MLILEYTQVNDQLFSRLFSSLETSQEEFCLNMSKASTTC